MALGRTVAELGETISSEELSEWEQFAQLHPFGCLRSDYQAALVASTIWNVNAKKKLKLEDFLLKFRKKPKKKPLTGSDIAAIFRGVPRG